MKVLVCGGRHYADAKRVAEVLDRLNEAEGITAVIEGGATGADALGKAWAKKRGIPVIEIEANWTYYGMAAGPIRNRWMIRLCQPDRIVAFPGGTGTANMVAEAAGIRVIEVAPA